MIRFAVKGLAGRKLRTALTAIAIVLGVAMVSGTYVLTDSISNAFDAIFEQQYENTDAVITGKSAFDLGQTRHDDRAALRRVGARGRSRRCPASRRRSAASAARRS